MSVILPVSLRDRIFEQLQQNYPNEGGGFLLGIIDSPRVLIRHTCPVANVFATEEQYHRYAMTPADWLRVEDEAAAAGIALVGYYHSHPNHRPIPSEYDRVHALPNFHYLITEVWDGKAGEIRAWQLTDGRDQFNELTLTIVA